MINFNWINEDVGGLEKMVQEQTKKELNYLLRSDIRLRILIYLYHEKLTVNQLRDRGLNYGSLLTNIKQLETKNYIINKDGKYMLANSTKMKIANFLKLNNGLEDIYYFEDYLNTHLVKADNLEVLSQLPLNDDYEIIQNTPLEPYKVVNNFSNNMAHPGCVKCIFTHIHPEFKKANVPIAEKSELKILVDKEIKEYLVDKSEDLDSKNNRTIKVRTIPPIKLSLAVTEEEAMFVLYNKDGTYDTNAGIISSDKRIIKYGNKLFDEVEQTSADDYTVISHI